MTQGGSTNVQQKRRLSSFLLMASISPKTGRKNDKSCFRSDLTGQLFWARKNEQNISMVFCPNKLDDNSKVSGPGF